MIRALLLALLCLVLASGASALAQDAPAPTKGMLEKAPPLVEKKDMMSAATAAALFKQCRGFYPRRFTPSALDSYCECSGTATQAVMTSDEHASLQQEKNRVITNPVFQKYVTYVIAPCMDKPTQDIEYLSCALDRFADARINNLPRYCQCVGREMRNHVLQFGDVDILISMQTNKRVTDPFEALWMSSRYMEQTQVARDKCVMSYMKKPMIYN